MRLRVAVRVDGSVGIGTGHVQRCLALAESLRLVGAELVFVTRMLDHDMAPLIGAKGFLSLTLPTPKQAFCPIEDGNRHASWAGVDAERDATETCAVLADWGADWVVVDHYAFDARWHRQVAKTLGCKMAAIDDLGDRDMALDLLVDHNLSADHSAKYARPGSSIGKILGGPRYALIGPIYQTLPARSYPARVDSIGIFMGGADAPNFSAVALQACRRVAGFEGRIEVASTNANPNLQKLRDDVERDGNTTLILDQPNLKDFFTCHEVHIGAGGGATWERCRTGAPSLIVQTADNQAVVVAGLTSVAAALGCPSPNVVAIGSQVTRMLADQSLRQSLGTKSGRLVDGRGCERIAARMGLAALSVRPAQRGDGELMHRWRNSPETRLVSRDSSEISLADHLAWLDRSLNNPARLILIGEVGGLPVGVVRFDELDADRSEVSIYLDPALHGLGLGVALLLAGEQKLASRLDHSIQLVADTLPDNKGSQALFQRAGYEGRTSFAKALCVHSDDHG